MYVQILIYTGDSRYLYLELPMDRRKSSRYGFKGRKPFENTNQGIGSTLEKNLYLVPYLGHLNWFKLFKKILLATGKACSGDSSQHQNLMFP